jgi:hypothetical protein
MGWWFGNAIGGFVSALKICPVLMAMLVVTWFVFPFTASSLVFPSDVIGFQDWMQGQPVRRFFTAQSLQAGFLGALVVIALMCIIQLNLTTLIYRKVNKFATFWPFAILLIAGVANGIWWLRTGYFDLTGALIGCTPFVSTVAWQMVCEKLGGRFVFGPGYNNTY